MSQSHPSAIAKSQMYFLNRSLNLNCNFHVSKKLSPIYTVHHENICFLIQNDAPIYTSDLTKHCFVKGHYNYRLDWAVFQFETN